MFSLKNKNAFVTGGASGIGAGVAQAFASQGATVVIADITDGTVAAQEIGAEFVPIDVSVETSVAEALEESVRLLGGNLDIVVLNAGIGDVGPTFEETDKRLVEKLTAINYWGVLYGLKHAPRYMNGSGSIISTSSMAAFINVPGSGVYSSGKRALLSMTEMAALELGSRGIRVNAVCPGYTATSMGSGDDARKICETLTALGRVAEVSDMTGVYVFLASDESAYLTGQAIRVDGGWSCGPTTALLESIIGSTSAPG